VGAQRGRYPSRVSEIRNGAAKPSNGIGQRLARFRKLSGLSARELAEAAGNGLTRGVIANIESGRKIDVSVDQLIAISSALGIPPVVLALPIDRPFSFVRLSELDTSPAVRVINAIEWFQGLEFVFQRGALSEDAAEIAGSIIRGVREYAIHVNQLESYRAKASIVTESGLAERESRIADLQASLERLQVDLTIPYSHTVAFGAESASERKLREKAEDLTAKLRETLADAREAQRSVQRG